MRLQKLRILLLPELDSALSDQEDSIANLYALRTLNKPLVVATYISLSGGK